MKVIVVVIDYSETSTWTMVNVGFVDQISINLLLCVQRIQTIFPSVAIIVVVIIVVTVVSIVLRCRGSRTAV